MKPASLTIEWKYQREITSMEDVNAVYDAIYDHLETLGELLEVLSEYGKDPDKSVAFARVMKK